MPKQNPRLTVKLPDDVTEAVRDCVYWERLSLTEFVEEALERELARYIRNSHIPGVKRKGKPYPAREGQLKRGRRPG